MKQIYDPEKHHRRSIRLEGYDYSRTGAYFVTVCVKNKENSLGKIIDGEMILSGIGRIAEECWNKIPIHYRCVQLDKYVIMPNHIHGIIRIIDDVGAEDFQPLRPHTQKNINMEIENFQPLHQPQSKINQRGYLLDWTYPYILWFLVIPKYYMLGVVQSSKYPLSINIKRSFLNHWAQLYADLKLV